MTTERGYTKVGVNSDAEEVAIISPEKTVIEPTESFLEKEIRDIKSLDLWRAASAEFLGLFLLTLLGSGAGLFYPSLPETATSSVHVALETGFFVAVGITVFGKVSGGHINPAISMGFVVTREITVVRFIVYVVFQTLGAIAGSACLSLMTPDSLQQGSFGLISPGKDVTDGQAVFCEIMVTSFLLFGTFAMIDPGRDDIQGSVPLMIGLIVSINVFAAWNISGGCQNPARNFGPAVITGKLDRIWIYWVGPMIGGALGALLYDKVFSTKVCLRRLNGCTSPQKTENNNKPEAEITTCDL